MSDQSVVRNIVQDASTFLTSGSPSLEDFKKYGLAGKPPAPGPLASNGPADPQIMTATSQLTSGDHPLNEALAPFLDLMGVNQRDPALRQAMGAPK